MNSFECSLCVELNAKSPKNNKSKAIFLFLFL